MTFSFFLMNTIEEQNKKSQFLFSTSRRYEIIIFSFQLSTQCAIFFSFFTFFSDEKRRRAEKKKNTKVWCVYTAKREKRKTKNIFFMSFKLRILDFATTHECEL